MADDKKVKNKVKGAEEQEVHVSANVSLPLRPCHPLFQQ
jgi:hypothetical protein